MTVETVIATEKLGFRYGRTDVVSDVSLRLSRGDIFGFVGPNGAGKTTTIKLLLGLLKPAAGTIEAFGMSMRDNRLAILSRIGALVETPSLYPHLTARENLRIQQFIHGAPPGSIDRALELTGLRDVGTKKVRQFSLGMKQRLGIAMALLHDPELLILDEPVNGLDPEGIQEFRHLLRRLAVERGLTVFISSHILSELEQTITKVAIIAGGRLRYHGTLEYLRAGHRGMLHVSVSDAGAAASCLGSLGLIPAPIDGGNLAVEIPDRETIPAVNQSLVSAGLKVYRLSFEQPNLEDIFMKIVARDGEGAAR